MISQRSMGKPTQERPVTAADRALVKELTGQIIARAEEKKLTRLQVGQAAGRDSASTLYGWRNGDTERPSLLDVNDFAQAVGLKIALVPIDEPQRRGPFSSGASAEIDIHLSKFDDPARLRAVGIVRSLVGLSAEAQQYIFEMVTSLAETYRAGGVPPPPSPTSRKKPGR